jgi:hypothetical protein
MVCIHLKRGYKKKSSCLMKELETNLGVIWQMNIFKTTSYNNCKGEKSTRYEQSSTFSCDWCTNHFQK